MVEAMGLRIITLRSPLMSSLTTKFHENLPMDSKVIRGTHRQTERHTHIQTDRQTGDLINLLSFVESRLKESKSKDKRILYWH
jgi:hypothetical protein